MKTTVNHQMWQLDRKCTEPIMLATVKIKKVKQTWKKHKT